MRGFLAIAALAVLALGCSSGDDGATKCTTSLDCARGKVCDSGSCKQKACTGHADCAVDYNGTFCWIGYDSNEPGAGVCSAIECKENDATKACEFGYQCFKFLCLEGDPECLSSAECKQPLEKCYNNQCVLSTYCELDEDCSDGECDLDSHTCVGQALPDVVEDIQEQEVVERCDPADYTAPVSYLCSPCQEDADCGCGQGICIQVGDAMGCSTPCGGEEKIVCPSGYICQEEVCKPIGGACKGCIIPPGCDSISQTCNFKEGTCQAKAPLCTPCQFDFECGFGNRCHLDADGVTTFCAPECDPETYACPLGSGCEIRDDGLLVCVYNNTTCCYGVGCEQECFCEPPTPYCDENNECVQCIYDGQCPAGKPKCDPETNTCIIQCLDPTPVYWVDPETTLEYCVQCTKSLHCPPGYLCGTFEGDPETYHKCYQ